MVINRRQFLTTAGTMSGIGIVGTATAQQQPTIEMVTSDGNYYFDPIGLHIQPETTVTFKNVSGSHSATAYKSGVGPATTTRIPAEADSWNSGVLTSAGATFEHTFTVEGTYDYFCIPHKSLGMIGRIVVGEPGGPAQGTMPPDGTVPTSETIVNQGSVSYAAFADGGDNADTNAETTTSNRWTTPLTGIGLFGGLTLGAILVYQFVNSEGERYRVGSSDWKQRHGLE